MDSASSTVSESGGETGSPKLPRLPSGAMDASTVREMVRRNSTERHNQGEKLKRIDEKLNLLDSQLMHTRQSLQNMQATLDDIANRLLPPVARDEGFQMLSLEEDVVGRRRQCCCGLCWATCLDMFC